MSRMPAPVASAGRAGVGAAGMSGGRGAGDVAVWAAAAPVAATHAATDIATPIAERGAGSGFIQSLRENRQRQLIPAFARHL